MTGTVPMTRGAHSSHAGGQSAMVGYGMQSGKMGARGAHEMGHRAGSMIAGAAVAVPETDDAEFVHPDMDGDADCSAYHNPYHHSLGLYTSHPRAAGSPHPRGRPSPGLPGRRWQGQRGSR